MDGFLITNNIISGKYGVLENGDLYIRDVTEQDSTHRFRCHTENTVTKEKKASLNYSRIVVTEPHHRQPPRIIRHSSAVLAEAGQRVKLYCVAQGTPTPSYRWEKLGERISLKGFEATSRHQTGMLAFEQAKRSDSGTYVCIATNSMGEEKAETELVVEDPIRVTLTPKELRSDVGGSVTFNCSLSTFPRNHNVVWKKDMVPIIQDSRVFFLSSTILQIRALTRKDAGMYQCFVSTEKQEQQDSARLAIDDQAPKLKITFSEKTVAPGSYVSFSCVASGNPPPQITWSLDGIWPVVTGRGVTVTSHLLPRGDVISYVNISAAEVSDSGLYNCEAYNEAGSESHSRRLNVYGPLMVRTLSNMTALAGDVFVVQCPFGGYPFDRVQWKKESRLLPTIQRHRVFPNGTLLIQDVHSNVDDGEYHCEVSAGQGPPATTKFQLSVRSRPKLSPFSFQDNLFEGMRTAVTCIIIAGDPPFSVRWMKDGMPLKDGMLDTNIFVHDNLLVSTLIIQKLAYRHNGNYTCFATNDFATGSHSAKLVVKVPPRWILEPRDTSAVAGRPARIDCRADGLPEPHVRWKSAYGHSAENFKTIVSSSHVHILVNGSLNFRNVEPSDAGYYMCEASNGVGSSLSAVVMLTVKSAPHFESTFVLLTSRRGQRVTIECSTKGDKPISFSWMKNGAPLQTDMEPRYSHSQEEIKDGEMARLIISKAERNDSALFTCTAINDYGEDSTSFQLNVQDIPDAPQNLDVHDVSSRSLRLTWNRPFDGNLPITQYTVAWRELNEQVSGGSQVVPGGETTLTIRGLLPQKRYFFRVKGENALGESQYSAEVAVTTQQEPPRNAPNVVKVSALSSRSVNVTWQQPLEDEEASNIQGFYIGFKVKGSSEAYNFKSTDMYAGGASQYYVLYDLNRFTEYSIVVQAFNSRGAGPPSEVITVRTMEYDPPGEPKIKQYQATSMNIKLSWDIRNSPDSPISGYTLHHRMEGSNWHETYIAGDRSTYTLQDLKCGTTYYCYLVAFNNAGRGNASEILTAKTNGNAPVAPEKRSLLTVNSTSACVHLSSWNNGGCPISVFVVQYKSSGHPEWTLVSNNILPEQHNVTVTDLTPGAWYSLLMTAKNDAGTTDAEYLFATLTADGEFPPHPPEMRGVSGTSLYRHLTITVPVISSLLMIAAVLCVVCLITRRRMPDCRPRTPSAHIDMEQTKGEQMPLSVTYESKPEPVYLPSPYAATRVPAAGRDQNSAAGAHQGMGTFGSTRSGFTYDIPYPPRRMEKDGVNYEPPVIYFPAYHHIGVEIRAEAVYEVPDRGRGKRDPTSRSYTQTAEGSSSNESDNEEPIYSSRQSEERIVLDEARESETECDRLWKILEVCHYEGSKRWSADHAILN